MNNQELWENICLNKNGGGVKKFINSIEIHILNILI